MVQTNILGTSNVIDCCDEVGAKCVLLSTDKACYPINALGFSKALAERVALSPPGDTHAVVRYGNVLGSRGSILEIWLRDAIAGRPILITDPAMTRFLLTLDQAVTLVTTALSGDPGLYILPAPATSIATLATAFQRIIKCPSRILNTTRAGEKKHECLLTAEEAAYSRKYPFNEKEYIHCTPNKPMLIDAENTCEMLCSNTVPQLSVEQVIEIIKPIVEELAIKLTNF
jgi:UDP-glucose 4-epimerase